MNKVFVLLDSSQSMAPNWEKTLSGLNEFISSIEDKASTHLELYTFAGIQRSQLVSGIEPIHRSTITFPQGMTPLYDNLYKMYVKALEAGVERTSFVVVTDGEENASNTYTAADVQSFVKTAKEKNWPVTFVGAGLDKIVSEGAKVGLSRNNTVAYASSNVEHTKSAFRSLGMRTNSYGISGQSASFSYDDETERGSFGLAT